MVTETVHRIPAADLTTLRVMCKKCERTAEGAPDAIAELLRGGNCPFCKAAMFVPTSQTSVFERLAESLKSLGESKAYAVEFVVRPPASGAKWDSILSP